MRTAKKRKGLVEFKDLSPDAQDVAIADARDTNLIKDWYKEVSDAWNKRLQEEGFKNVILHFTGFYRKNDGASFEADLNLRDFIDYQNVRRMVKDGVDILFIRRIKNENINVRARVSIPSVKDRKVWNQDQMAVTVDTRYTGKAPEITDPYTRKKIENYILNRAKYLATCFYVDLKNKFDILISDDAVRLSLLALGWRKLYVKEGVLTSRADKEGGENDEGTVV